MDKTIFQHAAGVSPTLASRWWPHVHAALFEFGILKPHRLAAWIAQVGHESAGFTSTSEGFNYSVRGLVATFGRRIEPYAAQLGRQPGEKAVPATRQQRIASIVYANRYGNRDAASGDGWRYRGRGLKQITFAANYQACGQALGIDLLAMPDVLATDDSLAARSAAWFWFANGCNQLADAGDFEGLTRRINGGMNGIEDRRARWDRARRILGA